MRETRRPSRSHWVYRACRAEHCWKATSSVARPLLWKLPGHAVRACRWGLGSRRSGECGDPLSPLSMSARTNAPRLCRAKDTIRGQPFTGDDGRIQDDRGTIRHQRKRLLHREQEAFHIDVEDRVIVLFSYLAEGGHTSRHRHSRRQYRACPSPAPDPSTAILMPEPPQRRCWPSLLQTPRVARTDACATYKSLAERGGEVESSGAHACTDNCLGRRGGRQVGWRHGGRLRRQAGFTPPRVKPVLIGARHRVTPPRGRTPSRSIGILLKARGIRGRPTLNL
jgi:hypothetical protein